MNMKIKVIAVATFAFCGSGLLSFYVLGQVPAQVVYDPTAHATQAQQVAVTTESLTTAKKQYDLLKKTMEKLEKVNSRLNELDMLERAMLNQQYTMTRSTQYYKGLKNSGQFSASELSMILGNFNNVIQASIRTMELGRLVLKNDALEMSDSERITQLEKVSRSIISHRRAVDNLNSTYGRIATKRATYKFMGKQ